MKSKGWCVPLVAGAVMFTALSIVFPVFGQSTQVWNTGGPTNNWNTTDTNWDAGAVWNQNNHASFGGTGETVSLTNGVNIGNITFGGGGYTVQNNTLTLATTSAISVSNSGETATINSVLAGGSLIKSGAGTLVLGGTNTYTGTTRIEGGTLAISSATHLPSASALTLANGGTLQVSTSNTVLANSLSVASGDTGVVKVGTGINQKLQGSLAGVAGSLTLDVSNANDGGLELNGASMGLTQAGSVVTILSAGGLKNYIFLNSGSARAALGNSKVAMNKSGGNFLNIYMGGGGTVEFGALDGGNSNCNIGNYWGGTGTLQINGTTDGNYSGNLGTVVSFVTKNGSGTQQFSGTGITYTGSTTLNGGVLKLTKTTAWGSNISMLASNAVTLQLDSPVEADAWTFAKTIGGGSPAAVIEKTGSGTVVLSPAVGSSFVGSGTGALTVSGGKLYLNASFATAPAVSVAGGATFGGTATAGGITVGHGGTIEGGHNGGGTLTAASLTLGPAPGQTATLLARADAAASVVVTNAGGLAANGGESSVTINVTGALVVGTTYPLIDYSGTLGGGFAAFKLGTLPTPGVVANLVHNTANTSIDLYVSGVDMPRWKGNQGAEWTAAGNWVLHSDGITPTNYTAGESVIFDNTAATRTVAINGANVSPSSVTFDNDTLHSYTLQGSHGIAAGTITKNGDGTVTISNANNTGGSVTLNGGTVAIAQSAGLGTGALGLTNGATLQYDASNATWTRAVTLGTGGGTLDVSSIGSTLTLSGAVGGAGGLVKSGGGTLALTASNNFGGATLICGGTLAISSATILPAGSPLTLANGATLLVSNNNTPVANSITIANGDSGVIKVGTGINQQVNGSLAGVAGNLTLDVSNANDGGLNLAGSAMETTAPGSVVTMLNAGANKTWLFFNSTSARAALGNSRIVMNQTGAGSALINLGFGGETVQLGSLDGGNSACSVGFHFGGSGTLQINGTASGNFAGKIEPGVALNKAGPATQTFSASGLTIGVISITGGTLEIAGPNAHAGSLSIASVGRLAVAESGSLQFTPTTNGKINGISGTGAVQINGSIVIDLTGANPTAGNTWKLLDAATLTESYGSGFSVEGFSETTSGSGVWSLFDGVRTWNFAETTGILSLSGGALHHRYDGNFNDSSGSANHGTPHGGTAIGSTIASGSGSLVLDGADDSYVSLASPVTRTAAQPWTITWWAKRDLTTPDKGMVMGTADGVSDFIWLNDSLTGLRFCSSANSVLDFTVPKDAALHHYALVADGAGSLRLYLDGQPAATLSGDTSFTVDTIGKAYPTTSLHDNFKGSLDEVHMLGSALGDAQIAQLHRSESPVTRLRIILIGGQSNADGQGVSAELSSDLQDPLDDVAMVYKSPDGAGGVGDPDPEPGVVTTVTLTTLRPGLAGNTSWFGPEIRLGHMLENLHHEEPGTRVAIIKYARGATDLAVNWKAGGTATTAGDGEQYVLFQNTVNQGMTLLAAAYPMATLELESMVWMQGESDTMDSSRAAAYQTNLTNFIADVRLTYGAELPFVIGRLSTTQTYFNATRLNQVRAAQDAVAAADPRTAIIYTESFGLKSDNIHFNTNGQLAMGDAFANETGYYSWMTDSFSAAEINAGLAEPDADADADGRNNMQEFLALSDPVSGASQFQSTIILPGDDTVAIRYPSSAARAYQVEQFNETDGTWPVLLPALRGTGGTVTRSLGGLGNRGMFRVRSTLP